MNTKLIAKMCIDSQNCENREEKLRLQNEVIMLILPEFEAIIRKAGQISGPNDEDTDDLRQELYIKLFEIIDKWVEFADTPVEHFLYKCVYNFCVDYARTKNRRSGYVKNITDCSIKREIDDEDRDVISNGVVFGNDNDDKDSMNDTLLYLSLYKFDELFQFFNSEERDLLKQIISYIHQSDGGMKSLKILTDMLQDRYQLSAQRVRYYVDCAFVCLREGAYDLLEVPSINIKELTEKDYLLKKLLDCVREGNVTKFLLLFSRVRMSLPYLRSKYYDKE